MGINLNIGGKNIFNNMHQWIFLFYIYCFMGWIWESFYVSIQKHKWVNRGFLKGPFLPIYGSGAIVVLVSTMPIKSNITLIFIIGMICATILEYITGAMMEKMFHVRYWDYSEKLFNINGHICLLSSLAWGVFSIILVKFANPPIERLVMLIPNEISEICTYIITIFITIDYVHAFNEAINLKNVLIKITERNETIGIIKKRIGVLEVFINEDLKELQEKLIYKVEAIQENKIIKKQKKSQNIETIIKNNLSITEAKILDLSEKLSLYMEKFENVSYRGEKDNESLKAEFMEYINKLKNHKIRINNEENNVYMRAMNILRRNPNAKSKKYEEAMNEVKNLDKEVENR